jgi:hypothetical protein
MSDTFEKISRMTAYLLNHYAIDGWEFVKIEEFDSMHFKSIGAVPIGSALHATIPVFIFKKECTDTEYADLLKLHRPKARCPNCDRPVNLDDLECSSCKASFTEQSVWRPIPSGD